WAPHEDQPKPENVSSGDMPPKEHGRGALPDAGGWMTNFVKVVVEHAELIWSGNGCLESQCHWCGGEAFFIVTRTSTLTGNRYADPACTACAQKWITPTATQRTAENRSKWKRMPEGRRQQFVERVSEARKTLSA